MQCNACSRKKRKHLIPSPIDTAQTASAAEKKYTVGCSLSSAAEGVDVDLSQIGRSSASVTSTETGMSDVFSGVDHDRPGFAISGKWLIQYAVCMGRVSISRGYLEPCYLCSSLCVSSR